MYTVFIEQLYIIIFNLFCRTMHPDDKTLQWIQCDRCNKWLHSDCAAIDPAMVTKDMPFNCGCDIDQSCYPYDKYVL